MLKLGSKGSEVKDLQRMLTLRGIPTGIDGVFGSGTKKAVVEFQLRNGLVGDGIVGASTLGALASTQSNQTSGRSTRVSQVGIDLIKSFEGYSSTAYDDGVGVWTIGWGTIMYPNGVKVRKGDATTREEATRYFLHDLERFEVAVGNTVKVPLNQNQYDALVSFSYNVGVGALSTSTAMKKLNSGDYSGAAKALLSWNKGRVGGKLVELGGLTRRRNAEKDLFLKV